MIIAERMEEKSRKKDHEKWLSLAVNENAGTIL